MSAATRDSILSGRSKCVIFNLSIRLKSLREQTGLENPTVTKHNSNDGTERCEYIYMQSVSYIYTYSSEGARLTF